MIPHIEKEYKMMITEKEYETMLFDYSVCPILQTNYYYATGHKDKTMRIRLINKKYIFTLKVSKKDYKDEYEFEIADNSLKDNRIQELLKQFNIVDPVYQGYMDTYRAIVLVENGELCIDKSIYNNVTDYELEYELSDPSKDTKYILDNILSKYGLVYTKSYKSKYGRFIDSLQ